MFWMLPLAGATAGGLLNRKNPLQGALLGAGLGATGGALAPGLLGAGAAGGGLTAATGVGTGLAAGGTGLGLTAGATPGIGLAAGSLPGLTAPAGAMTAQGSGVFGALGQYKPLLDATSTGLQAANAFSQPDQPMQAPQLAPGGGQTLEALASQGAQNIAGSTQAAEQERRMRRQGRRGLLS